MMLDGEEEAFCLLERGVAMLLYALRETVGGDCGQEVAGREATMPVVTTQDSFPTRRPR